MHFLGAEISAGGLEKHGLVETSPDVLRCVDKVLDTARNAVDLDAGGVGGGERRVGGGGGEGSEGGVNEGEIGGYRFTGGFHLDDGVGRVYEVTVAFPDKLPEFFLLLLYIAARSGFDGADLMDRL